MVRMVNFMLIVKFSSVVQSYPILCNPMDCCTPDFLVHHQFPELAQTHVHRVGDTIQPTPPLSSPSLPSIFPSIKVFSSESASVLPMNIKDWVPLGLTGWISLQSKGPSRVFSKTTVQKRQFFSAQLSLWYNSHICTWLLEKPQPWLDGPFSVK